METFSVVQALCVGNSPVSGEFPSQRPVTRSFDAFLDLRLNKRLSKQSWGWWFKSPSRSLWRHCNAQRASNARHFRVMTPSCSSSYDEKPQGGRDPWTQPIFIPFIAVTLYRARWGLKSPGAWLFAQPFVQAQIKVKTTTKNKKKKKKTHQSSASLAFVGGIDGFPLQRDSNAENICITIIQYNTIQ